MAQPKLTKLELQIMEALWTRGACSIREIQEAFPERRPAGLHHRADHRLPHGTQEGSAPRQEDQQRPYLRSGGISRAAQGRLIDDCWAFSAAGPSR